MKGCVASFVSMALLALSLGACSSRSPYATSLLGEPLHAAELPEATRLEREGQLKAARAAYELQPRQERAIIWYGRRLAYLSRFDEAIEVFSKGLDLHPRSYRLLRHRGHRYLTTRRLALAIRDFEQAAQLMPRKLLETEADGLPNARDIPISTTQGNVWYHLGLARYLSGDWQGARRAFEHRFRATDRNDDNRCSTAYWRYLIFRRLGMDTRAEEAVAAIRPDMDVIENGNYRDLVLLLRGDLSPADLRASHRRADAIVRATLAYGLSMHRWLSGDQPAAEREWRALLARSPGSAAFGAIAAEAELARITPGLD